MSWTHDLTSSIGLVEALRKRLTVKIKLWNGETVYVTYSKLSTCGCDLFNYRAIKLVTYIVCMCLNRSCTQCVCEKYKSNYYHCNYRPSYSILFMNTTVCSSACRRYKPLIVAVTLSYILLFLVVSYTGLYTVVAFHVY